MNLELFREDQREILKVIERIRGQGGEEYSGGSELARRNPVKADTAPILTAYAAIKRPQNVFEMGTAYGFSALHIGLGSPESQIYTIEFNGDVAVEAQQNLDDAGLKSEVYPGTVVEYLDRLDEDTKYDFVFIDHDKKSYIRDFLLVEQRLAPGALILADNVNDRRRECGDFVDYMIEKYDATILPTEAGLLVAHV